MFFYGKQGQQENVSLKKHVSFSCILTFLPQKPGVLQNRRCQKIARKKLHLLIKKDLEKTTSGSFNFSRENRNFDVFSYIFFDFWIFVDDLVKIFAIQKQKWIAYS